MKLMTAAKVVFVGAVKKATVAMKAFLLSLVTNPVGIITLSYEFRYRFLQGLSNY